MSLVTVYHGTSRVFLEHVRANGLRPPKGSPGVRVRLGYPAARDDARAYAAHALYAWHAGVTRSRSAEPPTAQGMIVVARVPQDRLRTDRHGVVRLDWLLPGEFTIRGPVKFPEFGNPATDGEPAPEFFAALERFEELTDTTISVPFPRQRVRRS